MSRIKNPRNMRQLIDFEGCAIENYIYPTDIDALIEYQNSEYIIFEVKYGKTHLPIGQKLALQRMVDDFTKAGKKAVVLICEHHIKNPDTPIVLANCRVREVYHGDDKEWKYMATHLRVKAVMCGFHKYLLGKEESEVGKNE